MIGVIIQARTGASRLPQKMTKPFFNGKGILETILLRLKKAQLNTPLILATTNKLGDDQLATIAQKLTIEIYRGSEDNVLDRFIKAAKKYNLHKIIRICADNPFLDINALKYQIADFEKSDSDYWCYCKNDFTPTIKTHYGFWAEGVTLNALEKINELTKEKIFQEHVTNFIYTNKDLFKIHYEKINQTIDNTKDIRLTIDTLKDFETAAEIYDEIRKNKVPIEALQILDIVRKKQDWLNVMQEQIEKNTK